MTSINIYLVEKNGSLHLSGKRFSDFSTIASIFIQNSGLDSVVLKVCKCFNLIIYCFLFTNLIFAVIFAHTHTHVNATESIFYRNWQIKSIIPA